MHAFLELIKNRISLTAWKEQEKEFTLEEVRVASFQMSLEKAPSPDGMTAMFYQRIEEWLT